jgi:hypothetical protein
MNNQELLQQAIAKLSTEELALIYPPIERANFVVRKNWLGRNQVITFINNKNQKVTYNHDEVLNVMLPKLSIMPCWIKRQYWSQSTDMPSNVRHLANIENLEVVELSIKNATIEVEVEINENSKEFQDAEASLS